MLNKLRRLVGENIENAQNAIGGVGKMVIEEVGFGGGVVLSAVPIGVKP